MLEYFSCTNKADAEKLFFLKVFENAAAES